jgi:hypothetical protein
MSDRRTITSNRPNLDVSSWGDVIPNVTISAVVPDFDRVQLDPRLACPSCGWTFTPHAVSADEAEKGLDTILTIRLRCQHCHHDAFVCEQTREDEEEGDE